MKTYKKYLPYIIGVIILFGVIGYFAISKGGGGLPSQTVSADSLAVSNGDSNCMIADFDEKKVYSGEFVFDAVLTDAASEKNETTFTIKIDGNIVSIPLDDNKVMEGYIYKEDLGIDALYDYGDDLHYVSMSLKPKDKEGKEWVGEYRTNNLYCDVVLKLKECKKRGDAVKVTESRTDEDSNEVVETEDDSDNADVVYSSSLSFNSKEGVMSFLANKTFVNVKNKLLKIGFDDNGMMKNMEGEAAKVNFVMGISPQSVVLGYNFNSGEVKRLLLHIDNGSVKIADIHGGYRLFVLEGDDTDQIKGSYSATMSFDSAESVIRLLSNHQFRHGDGKLIFDANGYGYYDTYTTSKIKPLVEYFTSQCAIIKFDGALWTLQIIGDKLRFVNQDVGGTYSQL